MSVPGNPESTSGAQTAPAIAESLDAVWNLSKQGTAPESVGRDGFPVYLDDPFASTHRELNEYLQQTRDARGSFGIRSFHPKDFPTGVAFLALPVRGRLAVFRAIVVRILFYEHKQEERIGEGGRRPWLADQFRLLNRLVTAAQSVTSPGAERLVDPEEFSSLASELSRTDLPFTDADLISFIGIASEQSAGAYFQSLSNESVLRAVERHVTRNELSPALRGQLMNWKEKLQSADRVSGPARKLLTRINGLLGKGDEPGIEAGEAWSNAAVEDLNRMPTEERQRWCRLLQHCQQAESSKPTLKWTKKSKECVEAVGHEKLKAQLLPWFELVALPRPVHREPRQPQYEPDPDQLIADVNSVILKGLVWACAEWEDAEITRAVSRLAQVCFKKVRNLGARCPRIGNACLYSLSVTSTDEAAAELTRLNQMVKQPSARKLIGKSLDKAAELTGQTREDLEESTVPTYGLDGEGCLKQVFGDFTAECHISGPDALQLRWRKADGNVQKSVPAEVKEQHAPDLKAFKRTIQDIEKMLPAQRQRLERLMATEREWEFGKWRERYLDHALLAHLARRLIWHFRGADQKSAGIWLGGKIVDLQDRPIDWLSPQTRVRLWHPLGQEVETVSNWRRWLESHQIAQPFKQAHREIYILTDAEVQTGTYSNRFAAHIIRQHQFAALAKERGWTYRLMGNFDSHNVPTLILPRWDLAVEFWVESPGGQESASDSGIFLHIATDQVRFCDMTGTARPLHEVPALIFSEVMRDVDLFVGVCSIGNDPAWQDRGEGGQFGGYWQRFAFGDLSVPAKTRREVLERLLPRLKIAGQCELHDKFLVVRGSLRTYKIHLGSSNILMEPNDRYLCIVPDRSRATTLDGKQVFLPFEGDNTLAVILSKAFMLADDGKIKDQSILNQIRI